MSSFNVYLFGSGILKIEEVSGWTTNSTLIPVHDITNVVRDYSIVRVQTIDRNYRFDCLWSTTAENLYNQIANIWHNLTPVVRVERVEVHHQPVVRRTVVVEERRYASNEEIAARAVVGVLGLVEQGMRLYNDSKKNQPKVIGRGRK